MDRMDTAAAIEAARRVASYQNPTVGERAAVTLAGAVIQRDGQLATVRALHVPREGGARVGGEPRCDQCDTTWPCPTRKATETTT